ncbi:MAG: hypothetical protein ABFC90_03750 [Bacteroidales bacterium]|nr:hypothetical protein [Bacteroidales bacterium]
MPLVNFRFLPAIIMAGMTVSVALMPFLMDQLIGLRSKRSRTTVRQMNPSTTGISVKSETPTTADSYLWKLRFKRFGATL